MGVVTLVSTSLADGRGMLEMSRNPQADLAGAAAARFTAPTEAPLLQSDRLPAGMLPPQQTVPGRGYVGAPANAQTNGGDIQQALR
jgi:hypothetical protein